MEYTTIKKQIKEFDVMITNDPKNIDDRHAFYDLMKSNRLRVYCIYENMWATFIMAGEMLTYKNLDTFIHHMLTKQFEKTSKQNS